VIKKITIKGFKSFQEVSLELGRLNIFIGTNASGKSNFFDALRVLQGIGYGFTIDEIFNGKPRTATSEVWEAIRGGSATASFLKPGQRPGEPPECAIELQVLLEKSGQPQLDYRIELGAATRLIQRETLRAGESLLYESDAIMPSEESGDAFVRSRLPTVARKKSGSPEAQLIEVWLRLLTDSQRLDPSPAVLREYSRAAAVPRMGERGENFAALIQGIKQDANACPAYESWLRQLTPADLDHVEILHGALNESLFALNKDGRTFAAPVLSDGTLRFAAIAAAFFQPDMPETLLIEEIENGIHPSRLRLLVELLRAQAERGSPQVFVTTHSPIVLSWLTEQDWATTFFCRKDEDTGASTITPLRDVPKFTDLVSRHPITDLFAEGWLEGAL